jgi:hypothetical protein
LPLAACAAVQNAGRTGAVHGVLSAAATGAGGATSGIAGASRPPNAMSHQNRARRTAWSSAPTNGRLTRGDGAAIEFHV